MKKILLLGLLVLVLFTFGCIKQPGPGPEVVNYHTGKNGIEITAINNLPPKEAWVGNTFVVGIEIKNSGAFDIEQGKLSVSGFDPDYIEIQEPQRNFILKGKQAGYPEGERNIINFNVKNIGIREGSEEIVSSFTIRAQYPYQTETSTEVCINPDIYNAVKTKHICEVQSQTFRSGQGAPVSITSIDQTISPIDLDYEISFLIHVQNKGDGRVLNNKLKVKEAKLSDQAVQCTKEIQFDNHQDNLIKCSIILKEVRGAYLAPFTIKLEYDYENVVDKKFKIVDLLLKAKKI